MILIICSLDSAFGTQTGTNTGTPVGLTTSDFADSTNFTDWNFNSHWSMDTLITYDPNRRPYLKTAVDIYDINFVTDGGGTLEGNPNQKVKYRFNAYTVTASPNYGFTFDNWTNEIGTQVNQSSSYRPTGVIASQTYTANFNRINYNVTFEESTNGSVSGTKSQSIAYEGETTPVLAEPDENYEFSHWEDNEGNNVSTANPYTPTIIRDTTLTAIFQLQPMMWFFTATTMEVYLQIQLK